MKANISKSEEKGRLVDRGEEALLFGAWCPVVE